MDNIPGELVQADGEEMIRALHTICNKIWQTGSGAHHGRSPSSSPSQRKATYGYASTTELSASSVTRAKFC
ncbi:hypothetical protein DPMN_090050 [Dreissena polymorpha]|uniref:Uncharacterized protein n=1 Tax=Dreissena polymorpha TaxID=45954 RepID=A0A9D4KXX2_DREPO|nr:hypothetical protein DPMN_090050 [Dreissena polymorpha]